MMKTRDRKNFKIIIANYRYFIAGGPEKYMFKFMEAVRKRGIEIIPFSVKNPQNEPTKYGKYFAKPRADELMYSDTKKSLKNLTGMVRATVYNKDAEEKLRQLIRDEKPDVVYILHEVNHLSPSIIRAAKKEGVRVVHRISDFFMFCAKYDFLRDNEICEACIHGDYSQALKSRCVKGSLAGTALRVSAMKLYDRMKIFDEVDQYITPSSFTRGKLIEGGIDGKKIVHIPTFIDAEKIKPSYEHKNYFLFLGRLAHQKGAIYAIQAMSLVEGTEFKLKLTGTLSDSEEDQKIKKYIEDHNLTEKIEFVGFKSGQELEDLINYATCIVAPAIWYENMPNTVIEAYAHGKPVVASRLGSLAEIIIDNNTGMLFEPKNYKELAEKFNAFVKNPALSAELGKNARDKCEREYSEKEHIDKVLRVLEGNDDENNR